MKEQNAIDSIPQFFPYLPFSPLHTSGNPWTANQASLFPFWVPGEISVDGMATLITVSSGNVDLGIYDKNGTRVVSTGSTASPGTGGQRFSFSPVTLIPSLSPYWLAFAANNSTIQIVLLANTAGSPSLFRALIFNSSFPLPASLDLNSPSSRSGAKAPNLVIENSLGFNAL